MKYFSRLRSISCKLSSVFRLLLIFWMSLSVRFGQLFSNKKYLFVPEAYSSKIILILFNETRLFIPLLKLSIPSSLIFSHLPFKSRAYLNSTIYLGHHNRISFIDVWPLMYLAISFSFESVERF